jgi:hypothetical protein
MFSASMVEGGPTLSAVAPVAESSARTPAVNDSSARTDNSNFPPLLIKAGER